MAKRYTIYKKDLSEFLNDITKAMIKANLFLNVSTKQHKDDDKIIVIVG